MSPRARSLTWKDIIDVTFVSDFDVLRNQYGVDTEPQPDRPWLKAGYREVANHLHKIHRAREEIIRCNVEAARVRAWVYFEEDLHVDTVLKLTQNGQLDLAWQVEDQYTIRRNNNYAHHIILDKLEALPYYSGQIDKRDIVENNAVAAGAEPPARAQPAGPSVTTTTVTSLVDHNNEDDDEVQDHETDVQDRVLRLSNVLQDNVSPDN
jgi:hypothetical protein